MDLATTFPTEGDEILLGIMAQPASRHDMANFQSATVFQYASAKKIVSIARSLFDI